MTTLALTDHDAIDGIAEAAEAARKRGNRPGAGGGDLLRARALDDMHMLGYWVDTAAIAPACERAQGERVTRAREIVERLNAQGVAVRFEDAIAQAGDARPSVGARTSPRPPGRSRRRCAPSSRSGSCPGRRRSSRGAGPRRTRGDREHPRGRGRRGSRPSILGPGRPGRGRRADRRARPRRDRVLLPGARPGADQVPARALPRAGAGCHRLVRLSRPEPQDVRLLLCLSDLRPRHP